MSDSPQRLFDLEELPVARGLARAAGSKATRLSGKSIWHLYASVGPDLNVAAMPEGERQLARELGILDAKGKPPAKRLVGLFKWEELARRATVSRRRGADLGPIRHAEERWISTAATTASTSYQTAMPAEVLRDALISGVVPGRFVAHIATLIDETPMEIIQGAVNEAAAAARLSPDEVMGHVRRWVRDLKSPREAWK